MSTDPVSFIARSDRHDSMSAGDPAAPVDKGHADRVAKLFQAEYDRLVHYMFARTGSIAEAHDVASQAFTKILEIKNPRTVSFLKAYVYSAARNIWLDRVKLGAIHRRIDQTPGYDWDATSPSPEPLLIDGQRAQLLNRAIEGLKPRLKTVLVLRIWDELTYREIASRLAKEGVVVDERTVSNWFKDAFENLSIAVQGMAEDLKGRESDE